MKLIVNSNRVFAALTKSGLSRQIILSDRFDLYVPNFGIQEVKKYKNLIIKKAGISEKEFIQLMNQLFSELKIINESDIKAKNFDKAKKIMDKIDSADTPFIALALELGIKDIWTEDKHFNSQKQIKVWSTKKLGELL